MNPQAGRGRSRLQGKEALITAALLLAAWQLASTFFPPYLVPGLPALFEELLQIIVDPSLLLHAGLTMLRIFQGLVAAFLMGSVVGIVIGLSETARRYVQPVLSFIQGIPALSWVVFAIIWFEQVEVRILFIISIVTLPAFAFQVFDSVRGIPKQFWDMVYALRPTRLQLFRKLVIPGVIPGMLTAWKVNTGNATRVTIVAELVGATVGVGYQLSTAQQLFNMAAAIAWTLVLVGFVLISQYSIAWAESLLLRWRPKIER